MSKPYFIVTPGDSGRLKSDQKAHTVVLGPYDQEEIEILKDGWMELDQSIIQADGDVENVEKFVKCPGCERH